MISSISEKFAATKISDSEVVYTFTYELEIKFWELNLWSGKSNQQKLMSQQDFNDRVTL